MCGWGSTHVKLKANRKSPSRTPLLGWAGGSQHGPMFSLLDGHDERETHTTNQHMFSEAEPRMYPSIRKILKQYSAQNLNPLKATSYNQNIQHHGFCTSPPTYMSCASKRPQYHYHKLGNGVLQVQVGVSLCECGGAT